MEQGITLLETHIIFTTIHNQYFILVVLFN